MTLDVHKYMHFLNDSDMAEEQKIQWLEQISVIVQHFVDLAFDSDQKALDLENLLQD